MAQLSLGSLGNLIPYLNGSDPMEERLKKVKDIFFIDVDVIVEYKEEVMLSWLTDIISSNKVFQYSDEILLMVWSTLEEILSSNRMKSLCAANLIHSLSPTFIQTLITTSSNITIATEIKENLFSICYSILKMPLLSPQLSRDIHDIFTSFISWVVKMPLSNDNLNLLCFFTKASLSKMKADISNFTLIYNQILYPLFHACVRLEKNENDKANHFLKIVSKFIKTVLFSKEKEDIYMALLSEPLKMDVKDLSSENSESFHYFLLNCIESSSTQKGSVIMKMFCVGFFDAFKAEPLLPFLLVINTMHRLGILLNGEPAVEKNSIASLNISQTLLDDASEGAHIVAILEAIKECNIDTTVIFRNSSFNNYLHKLAEYLITTVHLSKENMKALSLITIIVSTDVPLKPELLTILVSQKNIQGSSYSSYDQFLCEVLNVFDNIRNLPNLYCLLSSSLMPNSNNEHLAPETLFFYKGKQLLPPRFIKLLTSSIHSMGTQMAVEFMSEINQTLVKCAKIAQETESQATRRVIMTLWLSTRCLSAFSIMEGMMNYVIAEEVAKIMNSIADNVLHNLINWFIFLKKKEAVVGRSILNLIMVWSEMHINFLTKGTGYTVTTKYSAIEMSSSKSPLDFYPQAPFCTRENLSKLVSVLDEDESDGSRFSLLQMVFQKVSVLRTQQVHRHAELGSTEEAGDQLFLKCLDFILSIEDRSSYEESSDLIAFYLPSFLPFLNKQQRLDASRMLISGFVDGSESWINFGRSISFKRSRDLQLTVLFEICERIILLLSNGEKQIEELDESKPHENVSRKLVSSIKSHWLDEEPLENSFSLLTTLILSSKRNRKLSTWPEKEIFVLLQLLDCFPIYHLDLKMGNSIALLLLLILIEEGIQSQRKQIVCLVLRILKRSASDGNRSFIFKNMAATTWPFMKYFIQGIESLLSDSKIEISHIAHIVSDEVAPVDISDQDVLVELLSFMKVLTNAFVFVCSWSKKSLMLESYANEIFKQIEGASNTEAYVMAVLLITLPWKGSLLKEVLKFDHHEQRDGIKLFSGLVYKFSTKQDISKMSPVTIAMCLSMFTLHINFFTENRPEKRGKGLKRTHNGDVVKQKAPAKSKNKAPMTLMVKKGLLMTELCICSGAKELKKLSFQFLLSIIIFEQNAISRKKSFEYAWKLSSLECDDNSEFMNQFQQILAKMPFKMFRKIVDDTRSILKSDRRKSCSIEILTQSKHIINMEKFIEVKDQFIEQIFLTLPFTFVSTSIVGNEELLKKTVDLFQQIFCRKQRVMEHSKSFVFHLLLNINLDDITGEKFNKIFKSSCILLRTILNRESFLVANRVPTVFDIVARLGTTLISHSGQDLNMDENEIDDLLLCANELEKAVYMIQKHDKDVMNIAPFCIAKLAEGMQKITLEPKIKASIERTIFVLFQYSYQYSLEHVMVTSTPSVASIISRLENLFNTSFNYNPLKD